MKKKCRKKPKSTKMVRFALTIRQYRTLRHLSQQGNMLLQFRPTLNVAYLVTGQGDYVGAVSKDTLIALQQLGLVKLARAALLMRYWVVSRNGIREWKRWEKFGRTPRS